MYKRILSPTDGSEASARAQGLLDGVAALAREQGCDLIIMASHGRRGIKGLLLGSETQKVLVHSAIPVMVHR